jgi:hypothetical protein
MLFQEASVIHSNANLGIHGQGVLNLSGQGDTIEAQRLILSLFYNILVHQKCFSVLFVHNLCEIILSVLYCMPVVPFLAHSYWLQTGWTIFYILNSQIKLGLLFGT